MEIDRNLPVLITGATGYVAGWVVKHFLEKGFTVHAAIRDAENKTKRQHLDQIANNCMGEIKFFESDLLDEGSYSEAMEGCQIVVHTASPFLLETKDPQRDLIDPALKGTMNVLNSVNKTDTVTRVVITSSVAAIYGDAIDSLNVENRTLDETIWNTSSSLTNSEYSYSKTLAEKKAWEMCKEQDRWNLITINPSFVLGPALNPHSNFQSKKVMLQMGDGDLKYGAPDITLGMVDVRDVGKAHLNAALNPKLSGRYILNSESVSFLKLGQILIEAFGNSYPFPKMKAPKFLFWLLAPFFGVKRSFVSNNVGHVVFFDNSKSIKDLKIDYTPVNKSAVDFFQQFIDEKII